MPRKTGAESFTFGSAEDFPFMRGALEGPNEINTNSWDSARSYANEGIAIAELQNSAGTSQLQMGVAKLVTAIRKYNSLIDMISDDNKDFKILTGERDSALASLSKIMRKLYGDNVLGNNQDDPIADITSKLDQMSMGQSKPLIDVELDAPEDVAIVNKIMGAIVVNSCGFRSFRDYAGSREFESMVQSNIINRLKYTQFKDAHREIETLLFFGPPGTGKTFLVEATVGNLSAENFNTVYISISASDIKSRFVGDNEKGIKYLFRVARKLAAGGRTVVIFVDEIDGLITKTDTTGEGSTGLLSEFNAETQGGKGRDNKGLIIIGATNYPDKIPIPAFQRFSNRIFIGLPSLDNIREIIMKKLHNMGWDRINLSKDEKWPKWVQTIDWEREKFITSILDDTFNEKGEKVREIWGTLEKSLMFRKTTAKDLPTPENPNPIPWTTATSLDVEIFDIFCDGRADECPWDAVDMMTYYLWSLYYAPREIDNVFINMSIRAEDRSVYFSTQNPVSFNKIYYQKWLLEKKEMTKKVSKDNRCVIEKTTRFSAIPLWYTAVDNKKRRY